VIKQDRLSSKASQTRRAIREEAKAGLAATMSRFGPALKIIQTVVGVVLLVFSGAGLAKMIVDVALLLRIATAHNAANPLDPTVVATNLLFSFSLVLGIGGLGIFLMSNLRPMLVRIIVGIITGLWAAYGLFVGIAG
jgi:hypothetical protein